MSYLQAIELHDALLYVAKYFSIKQYCFTYILKTEITLMSKKTTTLTLSIAAGTAFIASLAMGNVANAAEGSNPFAMNELSGGYMQLAEGKCGEGKCGGKKSKKEGKCGEGKCGGAKKDTKKKEGKCGEGKCGGK